ncbi:MAG: UDP-N-acetylmuramate--L-alanine ligase, partial [Halieaceae bacterium]|nr:UDP-N-acetylmuramate--L-alanine ligase [Halieaceae bacterium]
RIADLDKAGLTTRFTLQRPAAAPLDINLNMPGTHNALNAAAAIAVACDEGLDDGAIQRGLAGFTGVGRRFTQMGELRLPGGVALLVDDYGHHPTEVRATLESARQVWPERRVVMVYQPHRYTRTRDLYEDFVAVLSRCDLLVLLDVYAAGEEPVPGADSRSLARSIRQRGQLEPIFVENIEAVPAVLCDVVRDGDVVITQGAGNIGRLALDLCAMDFSREQLT